MVSEAVGFTVFLLSEDRIGPGAVDRIGHLLRAYGFDALLSESLSTDRLDTLRRDIPSAGALTDVHGGASVLAIAALDLEPELPVGPRYKLTPHLDNARTGKAVREIARKMRKRNSVGRRPLIAATQNATAAWRTCDIVFAERRSEIEFEIDRRRRAYCTPEKVLKRLNRKGTHGKVELMKHEARLVVRKTYRPGCEDFMRRELEARTVLSAGFPEVASVLEHGENYFIMPYYEDHLHWNDDGLRLFPVAEGRRFIEFVRRLYDFGYAMLDWHPAAMILDANQGLKVIDFEYLHRYERRPKTFEESYDIAGPPEGFSAPLPNLRAVTYDSTWRPILGLSLNSLLRDSPWKQTVKRVAYFIFRRAPRWLGKRTEKWVRRLRYGVRVVFSGIVDGRAGPEDLLVA